MNELSERARELATKYMGANCMEHCWCQYSETNGDDYVSCEDKLVELIEQALLAERRLAMEEAAKMCDEEAATVDHVARCASDNAAYLGTAERLKIATFEYMGSELRAAAEKEVGTK